MRLDWLAAVARDAALPCMAVRLSVLILRYVDNKSGIARAKQDKLAADCGASIDTVRRGLAALVEAGHLVRLSIGRPGHTSLYQLKSAAAQAGNSASQTDCVGGKSASHCLAELQGTALQICEPFSDKNSDIVSDISLSSKTDDESDGQGNDLFREDQPKAASGQIIPTKRARKSSGQDSSEEIDIAFSEFWAAYPRKVAKAAAAKAFASAIKGGADADLLIRGAKRYAAERMSVADEAERERFTAHPATWLSAGRWADEATAPASGIVIDGTTGEAIHQPPPRPQQGYGPRPHVDAFAFGDRYGAEFDAAMGG